MQGLDNATRSISFARSASNPGLAVVTGRTLAIASITGIYAYLNSRGPNDRSKPNCTGSIWGISSSLKASKDPKIGAVYTVMACLEELLSVFDPVLANSVHQEFRDAINRIRSVWGEAHDTAK